MKGANPWETARVGVKEPRDRYGLGCTVANLAILVGFNVFRESGSLSAGRVNLVIPRAFTV
ncbi:hypothetical protein NG796_22055 [Laspinema sp. A4]|uniref:hypothetical protein n=1 Tax=Laspinema sp. D2d TaxID=2953686 RepID=UPI0021BB3D9F|nr:hypothetical protein [Laspinema sp. D2d]MCT7985966.1 hypothetical protein [Laspinema sp. D2d]